MSSRHRFRILYNILSYEKMIDCIDCNPDNRENWFWVKSPVGSRTSRSCSCGISSFEAINLGFGYRLAEQLQWQPTQWKDNVISPRNVQLTWPPMPTVEITMQSPEFDRIYFQFARFTSSATASWSTVFVCKFVKWMRKRSHQHDLRRIEENLPARSEEEIWNWVEWRVRRGSVTRTGPRLLQVQFSWGRLLLSVAP